MRFAAQGVGTAVPPLRAALHAIGQTCMPDCMQAHIYLFGKPPSAWLVHRERARRRRRRQLPLAAGHVLQQAPLAQQRDDVPAPAVAAAERSRGSMGRRQRGRFHGSRAPLPLAPLRCTVPGLVSLPRRPAPLSRA